MEENFNSIMKPFDDLCREQAIQFQKENYEKCRELQKEIDKEENRLTNKYLLPLETQKSMLKLYKPNIDLEKDIYSHEDIAIVLHFENQSCSSNVYTSDNPTKITFNPAKSNVYFEDHMNNIEKILLQTPKKSYLYTISAYLIASHSKYVPRNADSIALPTLNYFDKAKNFISSYVYNSFKKDDADNLKFYRIFYKPSYIEHETREQNDIELITDDFSTQIKIADKATIDLRLGTLTLKMPHVITTEINFEKMSSTNITMADKQIMQIHADCNSIFLMDV
jgi:hypothetical protein